MNLQNRLESARREVERLTEVKSQWDKLSREDPGSQQKADQAKVFERNLDQAKLALQRIEDQVKRAADPTSPEAKADLKRLDKINKEGLSLTDEITADIRALADKIKHWDKLQRESQTLAGLYDQQPFDLGLSGSRLTSLGTSIIRWLQEYDSWERHKEIMAKPSKPVKPKPGLFMSDHERMMNDRYPE